MKKASRSNNSWTVRTPTTANSSANTTPTRAACWVAVPYGRERASSARKRRPPSIGNAGRRLNTASVRLVMASQPTMKRVTGNDPGSTSTPT
jgi:hypothetical protein